MGYWGWGVRNEDDSSCSGWVAGSGWVGEGGWWGEGGSQQT